MQKKKESYRWVKELLLNYKIEMNKKLEVTLEVLQNVEKRVPEAKAFIKQNMKEVYESEHITVEEVICLYLMFACL